MLLFNHGKYKILLLVAVEDVGKCFWCVVCGEGDRRDVAECQMVNNGHCLFLFY